MPSPPSLFSIGEFSRITGLTIKTLRFYHDENLLPPAIIDADSGYRYYAPEQIELARAIKLLRDLEFPITDIRELLTHRDYHDRMIELLTRQKAVIEERIKKQKHSVRMLRDYIAAERQAITMATTTFDVQEKVLEPMFIAGIRMKGRYDECGKAFAKLFRGARGAASGPPMLLHFDTEYKENDADFEACIPLKNPRDVAGAAVRQLPGGRCVALVHKGPYTQLGDAYAKILRHLKDKGYLSSIPSREIYIKGPGMIFRGNPRNYLTEIQMLLDPAPPK